MDWVKEFYTQSTIWKGPQTKVLDYDRARAATLERLCGGDTKTVLELGAGDGATAAAIAGLGYDVVAMEFSSVRAAQARKFAQEPRKGLFIVLEEDFYDVDLTSKFDVVCFWDSFGTGSDADQRLLLKRIADDWLAPGGCALVDVFSPWWWMRKAGREFHFDEGAFGAESVNMISCYDFDPLNNRFINKRYQINEENHAVTQSIRCYTPPDLRLLLEGTGLNIGLIEVGGRTLGMDSLNHTANSPLWNSGSYLVKLGPR